MNGAILAQHPGYCPGCAESILVGEPIVEVDGRWLHVECAPDEEMDE